MKLPPLQVGGKPLESARWAGAFDSLGGEPLDALLRTMRQDGVVASFGNAAGNGLATSVLPFILRGVRLLGVNVNSPMPLRERIWARIGGDLKPRHAARIGRTIGLEDLPRAFDTLIDGKGRGRFVVRLGLRPLESPSGTGQRNFSASTATSRDAGMPAASM